MQPTPITLMALIKSAKKQRKRLYKTFDDGLLASCYPSGRVSWFWRKHVDGKSIQELLGEYPQMSIASAIAEVKSRIIALEFKQVEEQSPHRLTVNEAFEAWKARKSKTALTWPKMELVCRKYILNKFGEMPIEDLTAIMLIKHWKPLETEGHSNTLCKLCGYVRQLAIFCINTGRVDRLHELTKLSANYVFTAADHYPSVEPSEMWRVFYALEKGGRRYDNVWRMFMSMFYTLSRPGEIAQLRWDWIDPDEELIFFPPEAMKMKRLHRVPISSQLVKLLESSERVSDYVFPSPTIAFAHSTPDSMNMMLKRNGFGGVLTPHGIRSIGRTWMEQQKVPEKVAEACLSHFNMTAVVKAYVRYDYIDERRDVMQQWCNFVEESRKFALDKIRAEQAA